jgi:hypothetical protein
MPVLKPTLQALNVPMKTRAGHSPQGAGPLSGADPISNAVAGAVNWVAGGPGRNSKFDYLGAPVTLVRDDGDRVRASTSRFGLGAIEASGQIDRRSGRKEVGFSGLDIRNEKAKFNFAPSRIRLFNTDNGELRYEFLPRLDVSIPSPISGRPIRVQTRPGDQYVIGRRTR